MFKLIFGLWKDLCSNLIASKNEKNEKSEKSEKKESDVYLILAIETVYFVKNVNHS